MHTTNEKCPCINCICIPLCRHKRYIKLFDDCSLWKDFVGHKTDSDPEKIKIHRVRFIEFIQVLKPTRWYIRKTSKEGGFVLSSIRRGYDHKDSKYTVFLETYLARGLEKI